MNCVSEPPRGPTQQGLLSCGAKTADNGKWPCEGHKRVLLTLRRGVVSALGEGSTQSDLLSTAWLVVFFCAKSHSETPAAHSKNPTQSAPQPVERIEFQTKRLSGPGRFGTPRGDSVVFTFLLGLICTRSPPMIPGHDSAVPLLRTAVAP